MSPDVVVIGAGVVGCAVAREVARGGARVVVIDRESPCGQASWAAAGMLSPQAEADGPGDFLDLLLRARDFYPEIAAALEDETGIDVGYRREGTLLVGMTDEDALTLDAREAWQLAEGLPLERLTGEEARECEPMLSSRVQTALRFPGDHQVDNRLLGRALWFSATRAGAEFRIGHSVERVEPGATTRVHLMNGDQVEAPTVVIAAGSWSGQIEGLPRALPVEPVGGQLVSLMTAPPDFQHVTGSLRGYMVPRTDGRLILGATVEHRGFQRAVTAGGVQGVLAAAIEMSPGLADRPIAAHWSGFRPGTLDGLPILGRDDDSPGILYATGHYRNGILLAPLTGRIIGRLALGAPPEVDLAPFGAGRFRLESTR